MRVTSALKESTALLSHLDLDDLQRRVAARADDPAFMAALEADPAGVLADAFGVRLSDLALSDEDLEGVVGGTGVAEQLEALERDRRALMAAGQRINQAMGPLTFLFTKDINARLAALGEQEAKLRGWPSGGGA